MALGWEWWRGKEKQGEAGNGKVDGKGQGQGLPLEPAAVTRGLLVGFGRLARACRMSSLGRGSTVCAGG